MSKNIAEFIDLPYNQKLITKEQLQQHNYIIKMQEQMAVTRVKQINNFIIEQLYAAYKDTDISKLLVIDMMQFEYFLTRYLPIYLREKEAQKWERD